MAIDQKIMGPKRLFGSRLNVVFSIVGMRRKAIKTALGVMDALPQGRIVADILAT